MAVIERTTGTLGQVAAAVREALGGAPIRAQEPVPGRIYLDVPAARVREAVQALHTGLEARYLISVGTDRRGAGRGYEVLHFLSLDPAHVRLAVRANVSADNPRIPSITPLIPGAAWAEQEIQDLLGVVPEGHPDPRSLVLPDGFPMDVHPLRRDYPYNLTPPDDGKERFRFKDPPPGATVVQLGPFFPVLEEPSQWRVFVDGENVVGADYRGFFNHRAVEKLGDSVLGWNQVISLAERICGICGCVHSTSYCQAVEEAAGLEVPLRARVIRTLILELERLQSHLLWLGLACHIVGFDFVFMQSWKLREPLMEMAELLTGSRKHFACNLVGGTSFDITREKLGRIMATVNSVEAETLELVKALHGDEALVGRLKGVGVLTPAEARAMGAVGPTARASGLAIDARRDHPYAAYDEMKFDVVTDQGCDVWSRTVVRIGEFFEAAKIMRQCVEMLGEMPEGGIMAEVPAVLPAGREGMGSVEAPRGEVFHYLLTGTRPGPERWRVRAPSYQNLQAVPLMFKPGTTVADVPITIGSIDPCFSCTERMEIVDRGAGGARVLRHADLVKLVREDMQRRRAALARRDDA